MACIARYLSSSQAEQGTKYDLTKGVAAGPWGNPDRYSTSTSLSGAWERSIAIFRTAITHICQLRSGLAPEQAGILWISQHASATSVFVPVSGGASSLGRAFSVAGVFHVG